MRKIIFRECLIDDNFRESFQGFVIMQLRLT